MATKTISDQLRDFMRRNELSQTDVAGMLKTNQANVSRWLAGDHIPGGLYYARILELVNGSPKR